MRSLFKNLMLLAIVIGVGYYATTHDVLGYIQKNLHIDSLSSETSALFREFKSAASKIPSITSLPTDIPSISDQTTATSTTITPTQKSPTPKQPTIPTTSSSSTTAGSPTQPLPEPTTSGAVVGNLSVKGIINLTNIERSKTSASILTESAKLDASAKVKAEDIIKRQYFAHVAPDGTTVSNLVIAQDYLYIKVGENLALGQFTSDQDVVTAWMNSPEHKANMLDPQYQNMGVGIAYGLYNGSYVYAVVQHFGRPSSACPSADPNLKDQVVAGQQNLQTLNQSLIALRNEIEQGRAAGKDETSNTQIYNDGVAKYQAEYQQVEMLRAQYNSEAEAYNACIAAK